MLNKISRVMVVLTLGGGLAFGVVNGTACDDDDDDSGGFAGTTGFAGGSGTGIGGRGGSGGAVGGAGGGAVGGSGGAAVRTFTVTMSGSQEVPPVNPASSGTATVTLNTSNGLVSVDGTFTGLSSNVNNAHIHGPAAPGMNAGIIVPLTFTGTTSGTVSGSGSLSAVQVAEMLGGQTYINIHSVTYPMGELRGQITP
jgi:hypothetical protein